MLTQEIEEIWSQEHRPGTVALRRADPAAVLCRARDLKRRAVPVDVAPLEGDGLPDPQPGPNQNLRKRPV